MTAPGKLSTLLAVLALAVTLTVKAGVAVSRNLPAQLKNHGYPARSTFARGLDCLRKLMAPTRTAHLSQALQQLCATQIPKLHNVNKPFFARV